MMKKIATFILATVFLPAIAQEKGSHFVSSYEVDHGRIINVYPDLAFIVYESNAPDDFLHNAGKLSKYGLALAAPDVGKDSLSSFPNGQWVIKRDKGPFLPDVLEKIEANLPKGVFIVPAYSIGNAPYGVFAPIPNVLIVDNKVIRDDLINELGKLGMTIDKERSRYQLTQKIFKAIGGKDNAVSIRFKILKIYENLKDHIRFENLPLLAEKKLERKWVQTSLVRQWNLDIIGAQPSTFRMESRITVGIIDNQFELHPSLTYDNTVTSYSGLVSPASQGHGTQVAGVIGMNGGGLYGVTPGIILNPVSRRTGTDIDVAGAIGDCVLRGVSVINMSFGRFPKEGTISTPPWDFRNIDPSIDDAYNHRNVLIVAASGNDFSTNRISYPARHPHVMGIGGSTKSETLHTGSNYGDSIYQYSQATGISVVAPAEEIQTTDINNSTVGDFAGTSAAAPHVTGLAALLITLHPELKNWQVRNIIETTADKIDAVTMPYGTMAGFPNGSRNEKMGYGRINVAGAIAFAAALTDTTTVRARATVFSMIWASGQPIPLKEDTLRIILKHKGEKRLRVYAALIPKGVNLRFSRTGFAGETKFITLNELDETSTHNGDLVKQFYFRRSLVNDLPNDSEDWEVLVVVEPGSKSVEFADVQKELEKKNQMVGAIEFELKESNLLSWLIGIFSSIVLFVFFRRKRRPKTELKQPGLK